MLFHSNPRDQRRANNIAGNRPLFPARIVRIVVTNKRSDIHQNLPAPDSTEYYSLTMTEGKVIKKEVILEGGKTIKVDGKDYSASDIVDAINYGTHPLFSEITNEKGCITD